MFSNLLKPEKGTWVLLSFLAFFGVIVAVNTVFITQALKTHSGTVTDNPYKKGITYNQTLEAAQNQPEFEHYFGYEDGELKWTLPVEDAKVSALLFRPIKSGYDFEVDLNHQGDGIYKALAQFPVQGAWTIQLKAEWNTDKIFQTQRQIIVE